MPTLHQYDYLFAFGVIFCTLDAFMIGKSWLGILAATCEEHHANNLVLVSSRAFQVPTMSPTRSRPPSPRNR
jgi:hypothetical protein